MTQRPTLIFSRLLTVQVSLLGRWSPIPVTYAGGARSLADLDLVHSLSNGRVDLAIGSALDIFGGALPYRSVVEWEPEVVELDLPLPSPRMGGEA